MLPQNTLERSGAAGGEPAAVHHQDSRSASRVKAEDASGDDDVSRLKVPVLRQSRQSGRRLAERRRISLTGSPVRRSMTCPNRYHQKNHQKGSPTGTLLRNFQWGWGRLTSMYLVCECLILTNVHNNYTELVLYMPPPEPIDAAKHPWRQRKAPDKTLLGSAEH